MDWHDTIQTIATAIADRVSLRITIDIIPPGSTPQTLPKPPTRSDSHTPDQVEQHTDTAQAPAPPTPAPSTPPPAVPIQYTPPITHEPHDPGESYELLKRAGIGGPILGELAAEHTPHRIKQCIIGTNKNKKVVSKPGYIVKALKASYYRDVRVSRTNGVIDHG